MKTKIYLFAILFISISKTGFGQNLVPSPSFETDDTGNVFCGIYLPADFNSSIDYWITPTNGTPDLFSTTIDQSCWNFQPNSTYGGPICLKGPQLPRTGHVMAGIFCYTINGLNQREYVQTQLISPLIIGNIYYVEFYASLADNTESYTSNIGAYLSDLPITSVNDQPLNVIPQIISSSNISDTSAWTKVSGTFQATSPIDYITIGNFFDDASTTVTSNPGGGIGPGCYGAYYFIDDVAVIDLTTGIDKVKTNTVVNIFPNPVIDKLFITSDGNEDLKFILYDLSTRELLRQEFKNSTSINTEKLAKGIYIYEVFDKTGIIKKGKLVK